MEAYENADHDGDDVDDNDAVFNRRAGYLDRHQVEMQLKREQAAKVERVRYLR